MSDDAWRLGAQSDAPSVTPAWEPVDRKLIDGVQLREIRPVIVETGSLVEIYREEWMRDAAGVEQVFQRRLDAGAIAAWHAHAHTTDRLFATAGRLLIVLFDARSGSPSEGLVNELWVSTERPCLVVVPPRVWHGLRNVGSVPATLLNCVDRAYDYESPDHWRLPPDAAQIPYRFA